MDLLGRRHAGRSVVLLRSCFVYSVEGWRVKVCGHNLMIHIGECLVIQEQQQDSSWHLRQGFEKYLTSGAKYLSWLLIPPHSRCDKWWLFHSVYSFNGRQIVLLDDQDYRSCEFSVEVFVLWTCCKVVRKMVVGKDALHRLIAEENGSEFLR